MNRVPILVRNPAFDGGLEPDEEGVDPADVAPFTSGNAPIITAPASDDEEAGGEVTTGRDEVGREDMVDMHDFLVKIVEQIQAFNSAMQGSSNPRQPLAVPVIDTRDTRRAFEQEYRRFPNPTRRGLRDRLDNQIWNLLQVMQERVNQGACNDTDIKLIEGLQTIAVLQARLNVLTDIAIRHGARRP